MILLLLTFILVIALIYPNNKSNKMSSDIAIDFVAGKFILKDLK